jgi:hypothetical protein
MLHLPMIAAGAAVRLGQHLIIKQLSYMIPAVPGKQPVLFKLHVQQLDQLSW